MISRCRVWSLPDRAIREEAERKQPATSRGLLAFHSAPCVQTVTFLVQMVPTFIDLTNLEHLFKGDKALMCEWIELYLQESPQYYTQLTVSLENGDAEALATAAHDLQPQAHYIGSVRMVVLLAAIEEQALNGDTLGCADLLHSLLLEREAIDAELRAALNVA